MRGGRDEESFRCAFRGVPLENNKLGKQLRSTREEKVEGWLAVKGWVVCFGTSVAAVEGLREEHATPCDVGGRQRAETSLGLGRLR